MLRAQHQVFPAELLPCAHGRYAEKLWASDITCLKELSVLSAEHLAQMGVGNPAHAAVIKERAKTDLGARCAALRSSAMHACALQRLVLPAADWAWVLGARLASVHSGQSAQRPGVRAGSCCRRVPECSALPHAKPCLACRRNLLPTPRFPAIAAQMAGRLRPAYLLSQRSVPPW